MFYGKDEATYYLTADGWVKAEKAPGNWIERWHRSMSQSSEEVAEEIHWSCEERNPTIPVAEAHAVFRKFPIPDGFKSQTQAHVHITRCPD